MWKRKTNSWVRATRVTYCWFARCKRPIEPGMKAVLMGTADGKYALMHQSHAKHLNFVSRLRLRWADAPKIVYEVFEQRPGFTVFGRYETARNLILVNQMFEQLTPPQSVYLLSHEILHYILSRDLGAVASQQFDGLYHRRIQCLGGRSIHTFEMNRLHEPYHDSSDHLGKPLNLSMPMEVA